MPITYFYVAGLIVGDPSLLFEGGIMHLKSPSLLQVY